jgi:hypothetical protein
MVEVHCCSEAIEGSDVVGVKVLMIRKAALLSKS